MPTTVNNKNNPSQTMNPNLEIIEEYRNGVIALAEAKSALVFDNTGAEHASIIMSTIFDFASHVRIYASDMNGDISNNSYYLNSIQNFVQSNKQLQVIVDSDDFLRSNRIKSHAIKFLKDSCLNYSIDFRKSNPEFIDKTSLLVNRKDIHFAIGDDHMVRIELDNKSHTAICSFNQKDACTRFVNVFDEYFSVLTKIDFS